MPDPVSMLAVGAGGALLNYFSTQQAIEAQRKANTEASNAAADSLEKQLAQQERFYQQSRADLAPWREKGAVGLDLLSTLLGANGPEAQGQALQTFVNDPTTQTLIDQGTQNVLKNASATGNLRTGGTASSVAAVAPSVLNQAMQARIAQLTDLAQMGQGAVGQGVAVGQNVANQNNAAQSAYGDALMKIAQSNGQINSVNPLLNSLGYGLGYLGSPQGAGVTDWLSNLLAQKPTAAQPLLSMKRGGGT